jgi:hypothetical protein
VSILAYEPRHGHSERFSVILSGAKNLRSAFAQSKLRQESLVTRS